MLDFVKVHLISENCIARSLKLQHGRPI